MQEFQIAVNNPPRKYLYSLKNFINKFLLDSRKTKKSSKKKKETLFSFTKFD